MKRAPLLLLLPSLVVGRSDITDAQNPGATCQGTSTFTGYVPLQTITVTVDGNYTFHHSGNGSTPTAAIFYTPLPPCASVVVPESSKTTTDSRPESNLALTAAGPASTPALNQSMTTYTSVITWTETSTSSSKCAPNFVKPSSTSILGPPYANSSTTTSSTASSSSCGPDIFFGTFVTTQTFISAAPVAGSTPGPASSGHIRPQVPGQDSSSSPQVWNSLGSQTIDNGRSSYATVTVTKKTPVAAWQTTTAQQIAFPAPGSDESATPNAVGHKTSSKTPGATLAPEKPDSSNGNGGNTNGQGSPAITGSKPNNNGNTPAASPAGNNNNQATSSKQGGGLGSIINSAINSPFTTVGVTTSYGAASATVNLVNGVPVQVESSSVYIGGSYVAIPTGSSTAYVTVNQQTFTVVSGAVIGGSSTLSIHRSEHVSSSYLQAETLQASTVTQNGVVVTIEPTAAIVDGTTYAIGLNAQQNTVVVNGQTVTFDSNGVAFASTTYKPAMIMTNAYVVTTIGDLTFSVDSSQAIIAGTTYRIGAGALQSLVTTEIDGTTIIFGPSGIVLPSTTIAPTGVSLTNAAATKTGAITAQVVSAPTSSATLSSNSGATSSRSPTILSNSLCLFWISFALSTLPICLIL